jgi:hypothetical protein
MARNSINIDYRHDYYKGIARIYFEGILKAIISLGGLCSESGVILDYGCGHSHLKRMLNKKNVIGYDIIPELTETEDYRTIKPDKIVMSGVLEHLYLHEIRKLLDDFQAMNPHAVLITYLPTENLMSKIGKNILGQRNAHDDHVSAYTDINSLVEERYFPEKRKYIYFNMAQITRYAPIN